MAVQPRSGARRVLWIVLAGAVAVVVLAVVGIAWLLDRPSSGSRCPPLVECFNTATFRMQNYRSDALVIRFTTPQGVLTRTLPAGDESTNDLTMACHASVIVALTTTGTEVARLPGAVCTGSTWIFAADGTSRLVNGGMPFHPATRPT
jgi:hypothetical protein